MKKIFLILSVWMWSSCLDAQDAGVKAVTENMKKQESA